MNRKVITLVAVGVVVIGWLTFNRSRPNVPAPPPSSPAQLERKTALRLPAPRVADIPAPVDSPDLKSTNLYKRLVNGDVPKISSHQLETYLAQNQRNAGSLLAAF